jgi:hypothetical protein
MYAKGHGVKQSDENAVFWYSKAAVQGDKHSQEQLSLAHKDGKGVKKDLNLSVYWQMKCDLNNDGDVIDGRLLDISLSAGLIEFIAHNLREAPDFNNVTTIQFKSYEISDDVISGFAKLILTNSPLKNLEISTEKDPGEKNFLILVNALESNIQLTDLSVKVLFTGMKINEKLRKMNHVEYNLTEGNQRIH